MSNNRRELTAKINLLNLEEEENFHPYNYFDFQLIPESPHHREQINSNLRSSSNR